jgi:hypothetical protein
MSSPSAATNWTSTTIKCGWQAHSAPTSRTISPPEREKGDDSQRQHAAEDDRGQFDRAQPVDMVGSKSAVLLA